MTALRGHGLLITGILWIGLGGYLAYREVEVWAVVQSLKLPGGAQYSDSVPAGAGPEDVSLVPGGIGLNLAEMSVCMAWKEPRKFS